MCPPQCARVCLCACLVPSIFATVPPIKARHVIHFAVYFRGLHWYSVFSYPAIANRGHTGGDKHGRPHVGGPENGNFACRVVRGVALRSTSTASAASAVSPRPVPLPSHHLDATVSSSVTPYRPGALRALAA